MCQIQIALRLCFGVQIDGGVLSLSLAFIMEAAARNNAIGFYYAIKHFGR
jgi:hypothetical protein